MKNTKKKYTKKKNRHLHIHKKYKHNKTQKHHHKYSLKHHHKNPQKYNYNFQYVNPVMKKYEPIFTIIEPIDKAKQVLDFTLFRKLLGKYGLTECNQFTCMKSKIMFVWLNYDENSQHWLKRKYYNTEIYLQNSLTGMESISNKDKLHLGLKSHFPEIYKKHISPSFLLNKTWKYPKEHNIYIARPINILDEKKEAGVMGVGYGGKDIIIIHDNKTTENAKKLLDKYDNVLISEYIKSPLLFKGYKFHIRTFLLASIINGKFKTHVLDFGRIFTAREKYKQSDWDNSDIHDTHMKSTVKDWFFPKDFTNENISSLSGEGSSNLLTGNIFEIVYDIFKQIHNIFNSVSKLLEETAGIYENVKNGFNIFGIDLMIKDDFTVILIECNSEGTYKSKEPETHKKIEEIIFNWVDKVILSQVFNTKNKNYN